MKKQFAAIFAATAVLGVTTAFAANPFSDVTPDSWAYQAVSQLAASGIVNGYPDRSPNDVLRNIEFAPSYSMEKFESTIEILNI